MAHLYQANNRGPMATRWRRRRMCVLDAGGPVPAALESVSGRGARVLSNAKPECGAQVTLNHPAAGTISGEVTATGEDGIELTFACDEASVAFALSAITADMTQES